MSKVSFEQLLSDLEGCIRQLESNELSLDQSLKAYKQGVTLVRRCEQQLSEAQSILQTLEQTDAEKPNDDESN